MAKYCRIGDHAPVKGVPLVNGVCATCLEQLEAEHAVNLLRQKVATAELQSVRLQNMLAVVARWAFRKENDYTVTELRRVVKSCNKAAIALQEAQEELNTFLAVLPRQVQKDVVSTEKATEIRRNDDSTARY